MSVTLLAGTLGILVVVWGAYSALVGYEVRVGERVALRSVRSRADHVFTWIQTQLCVVVRYIDRHIIRLSWYYSVHSCLQAALRVVVSLYDYLERWFHNNRAQARALRAERRAMKRGRMVTPVAASPHLTSIAEHKNEVALTEKQKQKLKTKKLERE
jgi:hypothetical protein